MTTLSRLFLHSCRTYKKPDRMMVKRDGVWTKISTDEVETTVRRLSLGFQALGLKPGDRMAILSENRPEWVMADFAALVRRRRHRPHLHLPPPRPGPLHHRRRGREDRRLLGPRDVAQGRGRPERASRARARHPHRGRPAGWNARPVGRRGDGPAASRTRSPVGSRGRPKRSGPRTWPPSSTRPGRPACPRASCSATPTSSATSCR